MKTTSKFRASRRLRFEDTKRIMSPEMRPKSFGTFEKRALDPVLSIRPNLTDKPLSALSSESWTSTIFLTFSILYDMLIPQLYLPSSQRESLGQDIVVECCADKVTALLAHA